MAASVLFQTVVYLWIFLSFVDIGSGQRITPPPPGHIPVVSNGIVYNLFYIPPRCQNPRVLDPDQLKFGMVLKGTKKAIMNDRSPYKVYGNIELDPDSCLYIEPGTTIHFGAGYGMIINGTLIARGSERQGGRITMTKDPEGVNTVGSSSPFPTNARLVDGNTTRDGRLELFYNGKWRGICTNYLNYSKVDANVTCQQLGFVWGNFTYHSFSRNKTEYMLYEQPGCSGTEKDLFDCPGARHIRVGTHICDGQQMIGFECIGMRSDLALDYWRGLEFYNSSVEIVKDSNVQRNETLSWLEYLDISYAGRDVNRNDGMIHGRASISASPSVPLMNNVTITNGAYDGLNMTEITGRIHIANSTISNNRGHGAFIHSNVGNVLINMTNIDGNWGDGVKMYMTNFTIHDWDRDFPSRLSFCRTGTIVYPTFPILAHENIVDESGNRPGSIRDCEKTYRGYGKRITAHFLLMERAPSASGTMTVYDRTRSEDRILARFPFNNGSFPQSITSDSDTMVIRFQYSLPPISADPKKKEWCDKFQPCIRFLMEITAADGPAEEFRFINSSASNNNGYGVNVQDMRSKVFFNSSVVTANRYGAGIRIYQGAGEVSVNNTVVEGNMRAGINITYSGGYLLVNNSRVISNHGYGVISEYQQVNRTRFELLHKVEVVKSHFYFNEWIALRIGNYCLGGQILVNESHFSFNSDEAIEYLSCNVSTKIVGSNSFRSTNFSLAFNKFNGNVRHGVLMSPMVNTIGRLTNNTFKNHSLGAVRIDNGYDLLVSKWYSEFEVNYEVFENLFTQNYGRYAISVRLTQNSPFQKLYFRFNQVVNNYINDSSEYLNPRNRANAPIIVSSGNTYVQRNRIFNPLSVRDIATHLVDPSILIQGDRNWWETTSHEYIYGRIFDNDDRYNLAEIEYYPALRDSWLYGPLSTEDYPKYRWVFSRGNRIGGVLDTPGFTTDPNIRTYHVDKDIFILPTVTLTILPGTTLEFDNSIGMVVHGRLKADGQTANSPVVFKLYKDADLVAIENRTASVRLVDGIDEQEGRVEVFLDGEWGTVCKEGWTDLNSGVVCQQLGLTFNPEFGESRIKNIGSSAQKMHLGHVDCDQLDTDLTKCRALRGEQFSCQPQNVVFLRCQVPTWSGVTIPAVPTGGSQEDTQIRHVIFHNAGLLDYEEMMYTPALRIDYMFYKITGLQILNSVSDGVVIRYSNPHTENLFEFCKFDNNLGNGFLTRSPYLRIFYSTMNNNVKSGFVYDPYFTEYEALSVRNFIYRNRVISLTDTPLYDLGDNSMVFITTSAGSGVENNRIYDMEIVVSRQYRITLQILDYNPLTSIESVTIYDSSKNSISDSVKRWEIERDLVDFPIVSSSTLVTIRLVVNGVRTDRLTFAAHARKSSPTFPLSQIYLHNCTMADNHRGIVTKHYNNPSNEKNEIFHRIREEEIKFVLAQVFRNKMEAMYIPSLTKYHENFLPTIEEMTRPERLGEITYHIERSKFLDNGKGVLGDHNHVDFANNVWHWNITDCEFRNSKEGGFDIELPRINDMLERKFHSVHIEESRFLSNPKFEFAVNGYYAKVSFFRNIFSNNVCPRGLMTIGGMEKDFVCRWNSFVQNSAKYVFEMNTFSHSAYSSTVSGLFSNNQVQGNNPPAGFIPADINIPETFAIALRGVQKITMNRNLIENLNLQFELVAAISSLSLDTVLDVRENWWGTQYQPEIRKRIFDFDDWNNYAIADYFPQLTADNVESIPATGEQYDPPLDLERLGGRIKTDLSLPYKGRPYLVVSDLTVMPDAKLIIEPETVIEFYPNVGILVLGQIVARGLPFARITLRPVQSSTRLKRAVIEGTDLTPVRLLRDPNNKIPPNEGFLELYNASSNSWNIMCDSHFNERMAETVCRQLGLETVNVDVRFTHLYDYYIFGRPMYFVKEFWRYSYYCRGDEVGLDNCLRRVNYDIQRCIQAANYTYIRCGKRNLEAGFDYWGNIRVAPPTYEEEIIPIVKLEDKSVFEYIDIHGAGMLHGEKVGAIQSTYNSPVISNINITGCLLNGIDIVAPRHEVKVHTMNITGNLGYAINMLILNGESRDIEMSSFTPLTLNTVPYNLHGLVDICKMEKEVTIDNRLIVFYKYSQTALDCVKVIQSSNPLRRISLRFLQFNLFHDDFYRNTVEVYDGKTVSLDTRMNVLTANSSMYDVSRRYLSSKDSLSIHVHASPSFGDYGFIAEAVSYPLSGLTYPDSNFNHILDSIEMKRNEDGAILYKNVGEVNPSLYIDRCWIEGNGVAILNLTSPPVIDIGIQDTKIFNFEHNFVNQNLGGMYVDAMTQSVATHVRGNITNNVFSFGSHGETIRITGHHYQRFRLHENFIFNNTAGDFIDTIFIDNVGVNATFNVIGNNSAHHIVEISSAENTEATQMFLGNAFFENNTTAKYRSVLKVGRGKPLINNNYFVNLESDFEMEANPKHKLQGVPDDPIDATQNWWGLDRPGYINGKLWEHADNHSLVAINFDPFKVTNQSIIDDKCAPGWRVYENRCYRYMGAALPYYEAVKFCRRLNGFLAEVKDDRENFIRYLIRTTENVYKETLRVWVYAEVAAGYCSSFEDNYIIAEQDCHLKFMPFVCEKDPYISAPGSEILTLVIIICASVFGFALIVILVLLILWRVKSKQRKEEKFERTQSIRMSKTSLNKSRSTIAMLDDKYDKYSVSAVSSRSRYDSDEKSMMASAMSLASEKRRRDSRYDSNGYIGSQDRLHENGRAVSRDRVDSDRHLGARDDRLNNSNRRLGSRDRLNKNSRSASQDRLEDERRYASRDKTNEKQLSRSRDRLNRSEERLDRAVLDRQARSHLHRRDDKKNGTVPKEKEKGSPQEKKRLVPPQAEDLHDTDVGYTDDGFSENEFDDFTTTADEGGKDAYDTDAGSTVVNFQTTKRPPNVENEINSLHMGPSMNDVTYQNHTFNSTPSVDLSGVKSMTSFQQPDNQGDRPPTPPPPLPVDSYPQKYRNASTDEQRVTPTPQPRQRPTPVPRSLENSRENVGRSGSTDALQKFQNAPGRPPLHLSRESLNYLDNRREWLTDQMPEKQQDSDEETETETETESSEGSYEDEEEKGGFSDKSNLPHPEMYPNEYPSDTHYRGNSRENLYDPKTYIPPPYEPPPYEAPLYGNTSNDYPGANFNPTRQSHENIPQTLSTMDSYQGYDPSPQGYDPSTVVNPGSINLGFNRSRENIPETMHNMDYLKNAPYIDSSRENLYRPGYDNGAFIASPKHSPTEPMGSVNDVRASRENLQGDTYHGNMGSHRDINRSQHSLDHLSRSRENIHGSMASVHSNRQLSQSRENIHGSMASVHSNRQLSQSRENIHGSMASVQSHHRSRDNLGVLYLDNSQGNSRPQPMETEI